jgi:Spy/CpxP family protein refolding chaperone
VKSVFAGLIGMAVALAICAGMLFAQGGGPEHMHHGMGGFMGGPEMAFPLHRLNLSDDQKTQVKQIFQNEKPNLKPLMQQEFQARQQMIQLVTGSGNFDSAKAAAIASQEAQTHVQLEVEHAKIASQIYQLLNSDQKAKVADMIAKHQQRMEQHLQNQDNAPPKQ